MKNIHPATSQEFSKLIGIPYEDLDCYRLVAAFFKRLYNLDFVTYNYETDIITKEETANYIKEGLFSSEFQKVNVPVMGDLVIATLAGYPIHVAIYLGEGKMLHTLRGKNSCIERIDHKWIKRIEGYYRWQRFSQIH